MPLVAAVEMREGRPQRVRFDPVAVFSRSALMPWVQLAVAPGGRADPAVPQAQDHGGS
ncbi:hypothetical protein ACL9RI_25030 [Janthinobacterium sp. Mn2066]|uniref:hypothetical protein n=1 Tax=Janthinobacterium sp. Mn2066 TaxID=3395264 RepID=UPI003BEA960A